VAWLIGISPPTTTTIGELRKRLGRTPAGRDGCPKGFQTLMIVVAIFGVFRVRDQMSGFKRA
jgi:hypothetical protein